MDSMNWKKMLIKIIIGIVAVVILWVPFKLFIIGEPVDCAQVYYTADVNDQKLKLQIESVESAAALRGWKFEQDGDTLYISARKVLASPLFEEGSYETIIDLKTIERVSFGGHVVWSDAD